MRGARREDRSRRWNGEEARVDVHRQAKKENHLKDNNSLRIN